MSKSLHCNRYAAIAAALAVVASPCMAARAATVPQAAPAAPTEIVAKVNDQIITSYDLDQEVRLRLASAKMPYTPDAVRSLRGQALDSLIDQNLEAQEMKRVGITVPPAQVDETLQRIATGNKLDLNQLQQLLRDGGVQEDTLRNQVASDIGWNQVVLRRYAGRVYVGQEQIQATIDRIRANAGKQQSLISEIFIAVDNPQLDEQAHATASAVFDQLKKGAPLSVLARQYSNGPSAANGGDIGWVLPGQLPPELDAAIAQSQPPSIIPPLRGPDGWYVLGVRDRRQSPALPPDVTTVTLAQVFVPVDPGTDDAAVDALRTRMADATGGIEGCSEPSGVLRRLPDSSYKSLGNLKVADMPADYQNALASLSPGQHTAPIRSTTGLHVLMLCDRKIDKGDNAVRDQVEDQLLQQQLAMLARRYLRDLRRSAAIENHVDATASN